MDSKKKTGEGLYKKRYATLKEHRAAVAAQKAMKGGTNVGPVAHGDSYAAAVKKKLNVIHYSLYCNINLTYHASKGTPSTTTTTTTTTTNTTTTISITTTSHANTTFTTFTTTISTTTAIPARLMREVS